MKKLFLGALAVIDGMASVRYLGNVYDKVSATTDTPLS